MTFAFWGPKNMKRLAFIFGGMAAIALAGCNNNQDAINNAELNQPAADDLNALANDAAMNAENQALGNQHSNSSTTRMQLPRITASTRAKPRKKTSTRCSGYSDEKMQEPLHPSERLFLYTELI